MKKKYIIFGRPYLGNEEIKSVTIEKEGDFKYARIDITNKETKELKTIVRGYSTC